VTYEAYWAVVFGPDRDAHSVVFEFDLLRLSSLELEEWVDQSEAEAAAQLAVSASDWTLETLLEAWRDGSYQERTVSALQKAITEQEANWIAEYFNVGGYLSLEDDLRAVAEEMVLGMNHDWFIQAVAEHGEEAVVEALTECLEAYCRIVLEDTYA